MTWKRTSLFACSAVLIYSAGIVTGFLALLLLGVMLGDKDKHPVITDNAAKEPAIVEEAPAVAEPLGPPESMRAFVKQVAEDRVLVTLIGRMDGVPAGVACVEGLANDVLDRDFVELQVQRAGAYSYITVDGASAKVPNFVIVAGSVVRIRQGANKWREVKH